MYLPGIFCAISLLLCGLYPLAMGALPSPRSPAVPNVAYAPKERACDAEVFDGTHPEAIALSRIDTH